MISRIEGVLIELEDGRAHLRCGGLVYEVLVPAADLAKFGSLVYARKTDGSDREGYVPHKFVREGSRR